MSERLRKVVRPPERRLPIHGGEWHIHFPRRQHERKATIARPPREGVLFRAVAVDSKDPQSRPIKANIERGQKQQIAQPDLARLQANDQVALGEWIRNLRDSLIGIVIKRGLSPEDAEDVIQQVWIETMNNIGNLVNEDNLNGYVGKAVVNRANTFLRDQARRKDRSELSEAVVTRAIDPIDIYQIVVQEQESQSLQVLLERLNPAHREILAFLADGHSVDEVIMMTGVSEDDIHVARQHAAIALRQDSFTQEDTVSREDQSEDIVNNEDEWLEKLDSFTLPTNIRRIRISLGMNEQEFSNAIHIAQDTLYRLETGRRRPNQATTNSIIEVSPLAQEGKAAQLLRLQADGLDVMTVERLQGCPLGELVHYLRILKGQYPREFATVVGVARERVVEWEAGIIMPTERLEDLIGAFDFLPDSILPDIIRFKARNKIGIIPEELLMRINSKKEKYLFSSDLESMQKEKKERIKEEENWLRVVLFYGEGKTQLARAARNLRVASGLPQTTFARKAGIGIQTIGDIEGGKRKRILSSINSLIDVSSLNYLSPDARSKQLLRLFATGQPVISLEHAKSCDALQLIEYLCTLKGLKTTEVAEKVLGYQAAIKTIKQGRKKLEPHAVGSFIRFFELSPDEGLGLLLTQKVLDPTHEVSSETIRQIFTGKYLFQDHLDQVSQYPLSTEDIRIGKELATIDNFGLKIRFLRKKKGLTQEKLRVLVGIAQQELTKFEGGHRLPEDYQITRLMLCFGYGFDHPFMWRMQVYGRHERKEREARTRA